MKVRVGLMLLLCFSLWAKAGEPPPNILYIVSDDQAWSDFGFMGNPRVHTPNLDALAERSACFPQGYLPTSVCRPSLVTLLTGLYPHQHQIHFNHGPPGNAGYNRMSSRAEYEQVRVREFALIKQFPTLPGLLQVERGYRCLQTGKFWEGHWRNGDFTEGMTTFKPPPERQTFGGIRTLADGTRVAHGNGDVGLQIGRETLDPIYGFIDACEAEVTPWMVWYAPYLPHEPHDAPKQFVELAKKPGVEPHELPYYASIAQFDHTVGALLNHLKLRGASANTLVVFVCDNGWRPALKTKRKQPDTYGVNNTSKRSPFDAGLRTPILLHWPDKIPAGRHHGLVSSIDLMPTILATAGFDFFDRPTLPGRNLLSVAMGEEKLDPNRAVFGAVYPGDASSLGHPEKDVAYRWVRQGGWKLILPVGEKPWGGFLDQPALYHIENDPHETDNRFAPDHPKAMDLQKLLDQWWAVEGNR